MSLVMLTQSSHDGIGSSRLGWGDLGKQSLGLQVPVARSVSRILAGGPGPREMEKTRQTAV